MSTAFLICHESSIPSAYKQLLLKKNYDDAVLTNAFSGKPARGIRNLFIRRLEPYKTSILEYPIQHQLTTSMRNAAKEINNTDFMSMWARRVFM